MKRPFWMHQLVEYILGIAMVAAGTQSPTPAVPAFMGGVLLVYAASTKSAVAAFRLIPRGAHKVTDPVIAAVIVAAAVQPWVSVDNGTRAVMIAIEVVHLFVWWQTRYEEKPAKGSKPAAAAGTAAAGTAAKGSDLSTDLGRAAGRLVGGGVKAVRKARDQGRR